MTGVAVKITLVPVQIVLALAAILTVGVTGVVTVMVIALEVAVVCVTHANVEVMTTVTTSLLTRAAF